MYLDCWKNKANNVSKDLYCWQNKVKSVLQQLLPYLFQNWTYSHFTLNYVQSWITKYHQFAPSFLFFSSFFLVKNMILFDAAIKSMHPISVICLPIYNNLDLRIVVWSLCLWNHWSGDNVCAICQKFQNKIYERIFQLIKLIIYLAIDRFININ